MVVSALLSLELDCFGCGVSLACSHQSVLVGGTPYQVDGSTLCHLSLLCPYVALEHNHLIGLGEGTTYLEGGDTLHPCASRASHVFQVVRSHLQVLVASILFAEDSCILPSGGALDDCLENSHQTSLEEGRTCLEAACTPPFGGTQAYGLAEKNNHHLDLEEDNS